MVRRTKQEALATREQLLDAAERLFLARGISRTSLQEIASAAGLTRGAVYWHFKDKASLVEALMKRVSLPWEQASLDIERLGQRDALASLRRLALLPLTLVHEDLSVRRLLTIQIHRTEYTDDEPQLRERHLASINAYMDQLRRLLHEAQRQGQLPASLQVPAAALGLFALVDGLMSFATLMPENLTVLKHSSAIVDQHLAGLHGA